MSDHLLFMYLLIVRKMKWKDLSYLSLTVECDNCNVDTDTTFFIILPCYRMNDYSLSTCRLWLALIFSCSCFVQLCSTASLSYHSINHHYTTKFFYFTLLTLYNKQQKKGLSITFGMYVFSHVMAQSHRDQAHCYAGEHLYSVHMARRAFSTHRITDIPHQMNSFCGKRTE